MEIEYIRQLQASYMRMELENGMDHTEEEMLSHNKIPGLLAVRWQRENQKIRMRYDITGKIALDALLEERKADVVLIENIFCGICETVRELDKYLLASEGICLKPETIFYDYKTEEVFFCYYPEDGNSLHERLQALMEFLLTKTDHKNSQAVELAYGLYEELLKPVYRLKDLQEFVKDHRMKRCIIKEEEEEIYVPTVSQIEGTKLQKELTWKENITNWFQNKKSKMELFRTRWGMTKVLNKENVTSNKIEKVNEKQEDDFATQLLITEERDEKHILKYEGTDDLPDLFIMEVPFLIGSAKDCNGILCVSGISRHHAKISLIDDTYFIEDLNSTNGTMVEGGLLSYKTKVSIKKGAQICFANQPYRFL